MNELTIELLLRFLEDPNTIILIGGCCLMIKGLDVALMESNS